MIIFAVFVITTHPILKYQYFDFTVLMNYVRFQKQVNRSIFLKDLYKQVSIYSMKNISVIYSQSIIFY